MLALGIVIFALGILLSVCLHEAGHMAAAKAFGMKVTRYFVGFGPTIWSFRKGETEYGVKAIPAGGFVKIVGMTPQDDDVAPEDEPRAMWRSPVWKRTIVLAAGSLTHFALAIVIMWGIFAFASQPDTNKLQNSAVTIDQVSPCIPSQWSVDPKTGLPKDCVPGTAPASSAQQLGLRSGDTITAINGQPVVGWTALSNKIRSLGNQEISVTYTRDGQSHTGRVTLQTAQRPKSDIDPNTPISSVTPDQLENVGVLGITPVQPTYVAGPVAAFGQAGHQTAALFTGTLSAMKQFPEKVPKLWQALNGQTRDPQTPVSVVGASRIGGELFSQGQFPTFLFLLASLNFFVGLFNLLPLLPLDGGHIAIAWFDRVRGWLYAKLGRPAPGPVDYMKLMPLTYVVILIFGGFTLLTVAADIVNPIKLF